MFQKGFLSGFRAKILCIYSFILWEVHPKDSSVLSAVSEDQEDPHYITFSIVLLLPPALLWRRILSNVLMAIKKNNSDGITGVGIHPVEHESESITIAP
jgi:hypothetical protein